MTGNLDDTILSRLHANSWSAIHEVKESVSKSALHGQQLAQPQQMDLFGEATGAI
jgi:hypothetical protein